MKTQDLNKVVHEIDQKVKNLEQAKEIAKQLFKEEFQMYGAMFSCAVEEEEFKKVGRILAYLNSEFPEIVSEKIQLKHFPEKKENLPGEVNRAEPIKDKKYFDELLKFGKSFLSKESFQRVTLGIEWNSNEKRVSGSKPEFIVLLNDFDKHNNVSCRTLTAYQLWKFNHLFKGNFWVDSGYYLNGININSKTAEHFIKQFEKLGWAKNGVLDFPIKIDLYGLTFNFNKEGIIYLTDKSIYTQTDAFQNGSYSFEEVDEYGINIKSDSGATHHVPSGKGCFRCRFNWDLGSSAWDGSLGYSSPIGLVVRKVA